jgi:hypothetical protein
VLQAWQTGVAGMAGKHCRHVWQALHYLPALNAGISEMTGNVNRLRRHSLEEWQVFNMGIGVIAGRHCRHCSQALQASTADVVGFASMAGIVGMAGIVVRYEFHSDITGSH